MSYAVKITATAAQDLQELAQYVLRTSGEASVAADFVRKLREQCLSLADFPERGALPRDRVLLCQGYRYLVFRKDYLIFYTVDKENATVYIRAVLHGARDYPRLLPKI